MVETEGGSPEPATGSSAAVTDGPAASDPGRPGARPTFGWRAGAFLGIAVLVVVYAIAELTAAVPPLRDAVEHQPIAIAVLVVGTFAVLFSLLPRPVRRG